MATRHCFLGLYHMTDDQQQHQSILDPTPAENDERRREQWRVRMLKSMGLISRAPVRNLASRQNPTSAATGNGSRQSMPYDPLDPQSANDVAQSIAEASAQSEVVSDQQRIFMLEKRLQNAMTMLADIWPPMPRGQLGGDTAASTSREFVLVEDGTGTSGTSTTQCTFRYDVYDAITGELLGSSIGMTGNGRRDLVGKMHAATRGSGYLDLDGNVVLTFADEPNFRRRCTPT